MAGQKSLEEGVLPDKVDNYGNGRVSWNGISQSCGRAWHKAYNCVKFGGPEEEEEEDTLSLKS